MNFSRRVLLYMETRVCLKYFVNGCGCGEARSTSIIPKCLFLLMIEEACFIVNKDSIAMQNRSTSETDLVESSSH